MRVRRRQRMVRSTLGGHQIEEKPDGTIRWQDRRGHRGRLRLRRGHRQTLRARRRVRDRRGHRRGARRPGGDGNRRCRRKGAQRAHRRFRLRRGARDDRTRGVDLRRARRADQQRRIHSPIRTRMGTGRGRLRPRVCDEHERCVAGRETRRAGDARQGRRHRQHRVDRCRCSAAGRDRLQRDERRRGDDDARARGRARALQHSRERRQSGRRGYAVHARRTRRRFAARGESGRVDFRYSAAPTDRTVGRGGGSDVPCIGRRSVSDRRVSARRRRSQHQLKQAFVTRRRRLRRPCATSV